jgi:hypothetical protein
MRSSAATLLWCALTLGGLSFPPSTTRAAAAAAPAAPGQVVPGKVPVTWDQLPAPVRDSAQRELGAQPTKIRKNTKKSGKIEYGVTSEKEGKTIKLKVAPDGKVLARREQEELQPSALPRPVLQAAKRELGKAKMTGAVRSSKDAVVTYAVTAETKERTIELSVTADGNFLRRSERPRSPKVESASR